MEYEHVTVALDEVTVEAIEAQLAPDETVEDWVEQAVAERFGDGQVVEDPWLP